MKNHGTSGALNLIRAGEQAINVTTVLTCSAKINERSIEWEEGNFGFRYRETNSSMGSGSQSAIADSIMAIKKRKRLHSPWQPTSWCVARVFYNQQDDSTVNREVCASATCCTKQMTLRYTGHFVSVWWFVFVQSFSSSAFMTNVRPTSQRVRDAIAQLV
jgi:hypothetical protein